jgi:opacity protein-like surface antigen
VAWHLSENTTFSVGYRFLNIDDAEIDDDLGDASFDLETQQHVLEVGLTFGI